MKLPIAFVSDEAEIREQWATAIGRFIVTFAECEWVTYKIIDLYGAPKDKTLSLARRLELIRKLLQAMRLRAELSTKINSALDELAMLAHKRNLVAHNSPVSYFNLDKQTGSIVLQRKAIGAIKAGSETTLDELPELLRQTIVLKERLSELLFFIQFPENRGVESTT